MTKFHDCKNIKYNLNVLIIQIVPDIQMQGKLS